jgi:CheY-like chemotaxis protein
MQTKAHQSPLVLVVEDLSAPRDALTALLGLKGYQVATATDGEEALGMLRSGLEPCLILLDLVMPRKNGYQFRAEQLQDQRLAAIPVVVYSGYYDPRIAASQLKAAAYFQTPFDVHALLQIVETYCAPAPETA